MKSATKTWLLVAVMVAGGATLFGLLGAAP